MFFILSKAIVFFLNPLNWIIGLCGWGLWKKEFRPVKYALLVFFISSNPLLIDTITDAYSDETVPFEEVGTYEYGMVLGGYSMPQNKPYDRIHFNDRSNRLTDAIMLYKLGKIKNIVLIGGSAKVFGSDNTEAENAKILLSAVGIPDEHILLENKSRNTYENARNTKELYGSVLSTSQNLLITSEFHMPRAKKCFQKQGISFKTYASGEVNNTTSFIWSLVPSYGSIEKWKIIGKECVGLIVYKFKGYI